MSDIPQFRSLKFKIFLFSIYSPIWPMKETDETTNSIVINNLWAFKKSSFKASATTFQHLPVEIFVLWFGQCWIFVEQVGHKSQIEFWVPADDVGRGDKLPAAEPVGLNQHGLRPVLVVRLLNTRRTEALRSTVQLLAPPEDTAKLTLRPDMSMSMRGWSSSVPLGEIWFRRWK